MGSRQTSSIASSSAGNDEEAKAIQNLSSLILSRGSGGRMNPAIQNIAKQAFGDNFSKIIDNYEARIAKLQAKLERIGSGVSSDYIDSLTMLADSYDVL